MAIILGLDLSLTGTGVAVLEDGRQLHRCVIHSKPMGKRPKDETLRISNILKEILTYVDKHKPDLVVIEGVAFMAKGTSLVQLGALNYMVRKELIERDIDFAIVAPTSLKKFITNKGNSQKDEMMLTVYKKYGVSILDNNENDAYCLGQVGLALFDRERKITTIQKQVIDLISSQIHE